MAFFSIRHFTVKLFQTFVLFRDEKIIVFILQDFCFEIYICKITVKELF